MSALIAVVIGFSSGVFFRSFFVLEWPTIIFTMLLAFLCGAWYVAASRPAYFLLALFFLGASFGITRTAIADAPPPTFLLQNVGERVTYEASVIGSPDVRDASQRITLEIEEEGMHAHILAVTSRTTQVSAGDTVEVFGTLTLPEPFETESGRTFRYDQYLAARDIHFMISFGSVRVVRHAPWWSPSASLPRVKEWFVSGLERALPEPYAALAGGMVIGGKQGLGEELLSVFVLSGLVHIVVLSGYNVMVVADAVMASIRRIRLSRKIAAVSGAAAVLCFVLIAGAGAATVRAGCMALIALYARATGRTYMASRALLVVALLMLISNPLLLAFDPGFGLSIAATAGLIWLAPLIVSRLTKLTSPFWKETLAVTLAAQIAVWPLLLFETGNFSLSAIPANILVLPVVPLAMAFAAIAGIVSVTFGTFIPALALIAGFPAYLATSYIIHVAEFAAHIPFGNFVIPAFPFWFVLIIYAGFIWFIRRDIQNTAGLRSAVSSATKPLARQIA